MFTGDDKGIYQKGLAATSQAACDTIIASMSSKGQRKINKLGKESIFPVFGPLALRHDNHGE